MTPSDDKEKGSRKNDSSLRRLAVCSVTEALRREVRDIELSDESHLTLCPTDPESHDYFARVSLRNYSDLEQVGFVPRGLREDAVRRAISVDDREALRLASESIHRTGQRSSPGCNCHPREAESNADLSSILRSDYRELRRSYNPNLAGVIGEHKGIHLAWDSPLASSVHSWVSSLSKERVALLGLFKDITIGKNCTLEIAPAARSILAYNVRIHRQGHLVHRGLYLRIWATNLVSFLEILTPLDVTVPVWALSH